VSRDELCHDSHCITCSDEAIEMIVLQAEDAGTAVCEDPGGVSATVQIELVEPVNPGDRLLVHAGTAIALLAQTGEDP
jgi:hydrogenase maturation factor